MTQLRPYQETMISQARSLMQRGEKAIVMCAPTGSGKTLLAAHMLGESSKRKIRSIFVTHRQELVSQTGKAFDKEEIRHGFIAAGYPYDPLPLVHVASIQTLGKRLERVPVPQMIVLDECHHAAARTWNKVFDRFPDAWRIGLSASPQRLDGKGLKPWFTQLVLGPDVQTLTNQGYLSPYRLFAPPKQFNLEGIKTVAGDYANDELAERVDKPSVTGSAVEEYKKHAMGQRAIVRAVSILHSQHIAKQFNEAGIPCEHVDGKTPRMQRKAAMDRFVEGKTLILTQVELFGEGLDLPAVSCVIDMRPTRSLILALQFWGRALRPFEGKEYATIIDHAGNWESHGLPDDSRTWTLESKKKKASKSEPSLSVHLCPACYAAMRNGVTVCPYCGATQEGKPRKVEEKEGELKEVDVEAMRRQRKREEAQCDTLEDLQTLGKERGYAPGWAWRRWQGRRMASRAKEVVRV